MEAFSGIMLLVVAVIALVLSNSGYSNEYFAFFRQKFTIAFEGFEISKPLILWINDGLMAVFFLLVGLEIKRETQTGELSSFNKAALPAFAAVGGMLIPAFFYEIFNFFGEGWPGWGIPMATDIAFALGVMTLLGKRVPTSLKLFLTALAIVDDIGAVLVIAFFYTSKIAIGPIFIALAVFGLMLMLNYFKVFRVSVYLFLGFILWIAVLKSGIHATVAGVLIAIAIPGRAKNTVEECVSSNESILNRLKDNTDLDPDDPKKGKKLVNAISTIEDNCTHAVSPLLRLEHSLHSWVAFFIIPVFAFANAGIVMKGSLLGDIGNPIALGVLAGMVLGKPVGIAFFSWIATKLKLASLPEGVSWKHIIGVGFLGGIGFTMAIFIDNLAFATDPYNIEIAKLAILLGSLLAGIIGYVMLFRLGNPQNK
jgi:NhaA family Na+:H+ antiporter